MKLDDASWHTDGMFPEGTDPTDTELDQAFRRAGAHIALFYKWSLRTGVAEEMPPQVRQDALAVQDGGMTATQFLEDHCDWKLQVEDIAEPIRPFAAAYYGSIRGLYSWDVGRRHSTDDYTWTETDVDFDRFCDMVETRQRAFESSGASAVQVPGFLARMFGRKPNVLNNWRRS